MSQPHIIEQQMKGQKSTIFYSLFRQGGDKVIYVRSSKSTAGGIGIGNVYHRDIINYSFYAEICCFRYQERGLKKL